MALITDQLRARVEAWEAAGRNQRQAARGLGISRNALRNSLFQAKRHGLLDDPAITAAKAAVGTSLTPSLAWAKTKNPDGTSYSVLLRPEPMLVEEITDRIRDAFEGMEPATPVPAPMHCASDLLTLYPIADAHIGMMAWGEETGEDYDTKIAVARLQSWIGQAIASAPNSETAIILDVGDLTHADDQTNQTQKSKHILDVDTRHFKTLDMTITALSTAIDLAKAKHARVIVRILPGNHNPTTYMAVLFALSARYRLDDRVQVQKIAGEFFVHQFGKCLISAHHGDKAKAQRIVMFLADQFAGVWGKTLHRYLWTGHLHHHKSEDIGGVQWEQLRAVTAKDAWASSHAYSARAQLQAVTYHRDKGEVQRVKVSG